MAEDGLYDPQFMIVSKSAIEREVPFSDSLKNSSALSVWIDHEKRVVRIVSTVRNMKNDSQILKATNPVLCADLGNFCVKFWSTNKKLKKEIDLYLPLLKEKHQYERRHALRKLNSEFEKRFTEWCNHHSNLGYISNLPKIMKDEGELLKFCKFFDQFAELKRNLSRELDTINNMMQQDEK